MKFSRSALFHMKTRICVKYFVHDGRFILQGISFCCHKGRFWCASFKLIFVNGKINNSLWINLCSWYIYIPKNQHKLLILMSCFVEMRHGSQGESLFTFTKKIFNGEFHFFSGRVQFFSLTLKKRLVLLVTVRLFHLNNNALIGNE